jgi:hypothetical protein
MGRRYARPVIEDLTPVARATGQVSPLTCTSGGNARTYCYYGPDGSIVDCVSGANAQGPSSGCNPGAVANPWPCTSGGDRA